MRTPTKYEGADYARPAILRTEFPETIRLARHCAQLWFHGDSGGTLAEFRDLKCAEHCQRYKEPETQRMLRTFAFERAYAEEVGRYIVERRNATPIA